MRAHACWLLLSCLLLSDQLLASPIVMLYFPISGAIRLFRTARVLRHLLRAATVFRRLHRTRHLLSAVPLLLLRRPSFGLFRGPRLLSPRLLSPLLGSRGDNCWKRVACEMLGKGGGERDSSPSRIDFPEDRNGLKLSFNLADPDCRESFSACPSDALQVLKSLVARPSINPVDTPLAATSEPFIKLHLLM